MDTKIISILEKVPVQSACSVAQVLNVDHATVLHCLYEKMESKSYCLLWLRHVLTGELRAKRKEHTVLMIPYLEAARKDDWTHVLASDGSWFGPSLWPSPNVGFG
jgi:hypothetical protein